MINVVEDVLKNHTEDEVIAYLHNGMKNISKVLDDAVTKQNLMEIGAISPAIAQYTAILKGLKDANDLRKAEQRLH